LNCIKKYNFTFTVSVSKEPGIEGKIIFEDMNYEILKNDNSANKIVSLEEFARLLLAETDDPLAEQYKTHKPLFPNKEVGLKIAASDIKDVSSIANENAKLATEAYLLSFVSDIEDKFVVLLEKRNIFGDHLIYKINKDNFEKIANIYPACISTEIRKQIFRELESEKRVSCFVKNKIFNLEDENQIFEYFNKPELISKEGRDFLQDIKKIMQDEKRVFETDNFKLLDIDVNKQLHAHAKDIDDQRKVLKDSGTIQKAEINREIESLTQESPLLYDYCNAFYWNIDGIIKACRIAETKMFKNNISEKEAIIKMLAKGIDLITQSLLIDVLKDLACSILKARRERKCGNKVISINDIIRNKIGMEDLDDSLKKIAINKTQERRSEIINLQKTPVSNSYSSKSQTKIQLIKEFVFPKALDRYDKDNIAVQLALKDAILFIESLYTNRDHILKSKERY